MDTQQLAAVITALTANPQSQAAPSVGVAGSLIGQYVIIRSRNEGINAGVVTEADASGVVLKGARRLWRHTPADKSQSWYEGVANHGLSDDSKISAAVDAKVIIEDYSATICTAIARQSIEAAVPHAQK